MLHVDIKSDGLSQETVATEVTATANNLKKVLWALAPKKEDGLATADAAVTKFCMASLTTNWWDPRDKDGNVSGERCYSATTKVQAIFRDFDKLNEVASILAKTPHATIARTNWELTDATMLDLGCESRQAAMRDAVRKADDYAGIVERHAVAVEITAPDSHIVTRGRTLQTARSAGGSVANTQTFISLQPEDVAMSTSIDVKFVAE